jgi:phosphoglucomutase
MSVQTVAVRPFAGQKPGTSGLRKKVRAFQEPHYLAAYVQATLDSLDGLAGATLVLGGDGRFFNAEAIQTILKLAAANDVARVIVGQGGLLSTPAASAVIRDRKAYGGLVLSASHNPGGPEGDFGVKYNIANGGPAPEKVTDRIHARTGQIDHYRILEAPDVDLGSLGETRLGAMTVQIVDPVETYAGLMQSLFDFDAIRDLFRGGFRMRFDAMHAVTGPYAHRILEGMLGPRPGPWSTARPCPISAATIPTPTWSIAPSWWRS